VSAPPPPQRVPVDVTAARKCTDDVKRLLGATIVRASSFTEEERNRRVNNEWSTVESFRHIIMVVDGWLGKIIKGEDDPYHPIGLPPHFAPRVLPGSSIDPDAHPTFDEACDVMRGRIETLEAFVDGLDTDELARDIGTHARTVAGGLGVIFDELTYHNGFINRDLNVIEGKRS
jgi:hypothetical protein